MKLIPIYTLFVISLLSWKKDPTICVTCYEIDAVEGFTNPYSTCWTDSTEILREALNNINTAGSCVYGEP